MHSKRAGVFLVLIPVLIFAQWHLSASGSQVAQGTSRPQVGFQGALPLTHLGRAGPGRQLRRSPFSPWGKTRMRQNFGHRGTGQADPAPNPIFLTAPTYGSGGYYAESVAVGDVNGDGKPDLVVANECADSACMNHGFVGVLLGNGDGTFRPVVTYDSGGYNAISVTVADVNGDGKPDLVVANACATSDCSTGGAVSVLLGNGDGTFRAAPSYGSGGQDTYSVAVEDVNGDHKPDLLVANYCADTNCLTDGSVGVLLGNGDGTFRAALTYDSGAYHTVSVAVGDVNGDGKPDLVLASDCANSSNCANGSVGVLLGDGNGRFQAAVSYSSGGQGAESVAVADVNGDGKLDLLVAVLFPNNGGNPEHSGVGVLLGNGDGIFQAAVVYDSGGYDPQSVAVADVNGDGKPDLLVANCAGSSADCSEGRNGAASVLLGNGDGTFQAAVTSASGGYDSTSVAVADINGDGKPDLVAVNAYACSGTSSGCSKGAVGVLLGNGNGTFRGAVIYGSGGNIAFSVAVGDVNGDGKLDLLTAVRCSDTGDCANSAVGVLLGNGDGTFLTAITYGSGGYDARSVAVADVNGDGKPDLVVANECASESNCNGTVGVLLGNGDGTFQTAIAHGSGGYYANSVVVADVNGDGKPDLVVANLCADPTCTRAIIGVLLGNGDGTFQAAVTYGSGGYYADSLAVTDVNGDGKPDLLVANQCAIDSNCGSSGALGLLLGNGDGTFQAAVTYGPGGQFPYSLAVGDVNRDGKPDLVVANQCDNSGTCANGSLGVLLGNGDGTFQAASSTTIPAYGFGAIALGDYNGDGNLDVASGGAVLLLGNGDGSFQSFTALGAGGFGIAVGDFNRDGKPDLAVGGVTVLLNISVFPTTTTITSSSNPSVFGQSVTFSATVAPKASGTPTGTVTFRSGSKILGTSPLNGGTAKFSTAALAVGRHCITADYSGDSNFAASKSPALHQLVNRATTTTTLVSSVNPPTVGLSVTFTATIVPQYSGTPTGTVTFKNGATIMGKVQLRGGRAIFNKVFNSAGTKSITASYSCSVNFRPSEAGLTLEF
jgi:hypothetical protein